jgi:hypothetical protein
MPNISFDRPELPESVLTTNVARDAAVVAAMALRFPKASTDATAK